MARPMYSSYLNPLLITVFLSLLGGACRGDHFSLSPDPLSPEPGTSMTAEGSPANLSLIYENNPTTVTLNDVALVLAFTQLPPDQQTPENLADQANALLGFEWIEAVDLDPLLTVSNADYATPAGTVDSVDVAVVLAALQLPMSLRTQTHLADRTNQLLGPGSTLTAADILRIPGEPLVGADPQISINDFTVIETDVTDTTATFIVSLSSGSESMITVDYTTADATATAGEDYTTTSGTLTFMPGERNQIIVVPVLGDQDVESQETFFVELSNPVNAVLNVSQGVGTIIDQDLIDSSRPPLIAINDFLIGEGDSGTRDASFLVVLFNPNGQPLSIDYATMDDTAIANQDYISTSGRLTFTPGAPASQLITVPVIGNTQEQDNRAFFVELFNPDPSDVQIANSQGIGTILDDDMIVVPKPSPTMTVTPTPTPTITGTPTPTPTLTPTPIPTLTPTPTPIPTVSLNDPIPTNTFAGDLRIDVEVEGFPTASFTIPGSNGVATFGFLTSQPSGVTAYGVADTGSALINVGGIMEFQLPGFTTECVIVRDLTDPSFPEITRSTTCPTPTPTPNLDQVILQTALPANTFAGDVQIDVQQDSFPTSTFTVPGSNGTATFGFQSIQSPGFTAYVVSDVSSALINLSGLKQFTLPGIGNTCVIIRDLSTPGTPEITRSTSASCP